MGIIPRSINNAFQRNAELFCSRRYTTIIASTSSSSVSDGSSSSFADIYNDLSTRFLRDSLNSTNRNIVFRPRRAKELISRKHAIVVNGEQLRPQEYKGKPGRGDLFRLLAEVSNVEEYQNAKTALRNYGKYSKENLQPLHLAHFVRAGAFVGQLEDAYRTVATDQLFKNTQSYRKKDKKKDSQQQRPLLLSDVVHKELLRLRVIRSESSSRPSAASYHVYKAWDRCSTESKVGLDTSFLLVAGLANSIQRAVAIDDVKTQQALERRLKTNLVKLQKQIDDLVDKQEGDIVVDSTIGNSVRLPYVVDLTLGLQAVETIASRLPDANAINKDKVKSIIAAWSKTLSQDMVDNYIEKVRKGFITSEEEEKDVEHQADN